MFRVLIVVIVFIFSCRSNLSSPQQGEMILNDCQKRWKIIELDKQFTGKVLFHAAASPACGVLATGAVTIIQTDDGSNYRIIEYCNTDKNFAIGAVVRVKPERNTAIPLIADDKRQCELLLTLFGQVQSSD